MQNASKCTNAISKQISEKRKKLPSPAQSTMLNNAKKDNVMKIAQITITPRRENAEILVDAQATPTKITAVRKPVVKVESKGTVTSSTAKDKDPLEDKANIEAGNTNTKKLFAGEASNKLGASKGVEKLPKDEPTAKKFTCNKCSLRFSSAAWHAKHMKKFHENTSTTENQSENKIGVSATMPVTIGQSDTKQKIDATFYKEQVRQQQDALSQVQKQVEQSKIIRKTLETQKLNAKGKKAKLSPGKSLLREQLKLQLEAQRQLLQIQQQIFEKANKAQDDIYKLIAELDHDDDDSDNEDEADVIEHDKVKNENNKHNEFIEGEDEVEEMKEEIVVPEPVYTFENYHIEDGNSANEGEYIVVGDGGSSYAEKEYEESFISKNDKDVVVVVQTDEGDEEFELFEVVEDPIPGNISYGTDRMDLEIISKDDDGVHCRIVSSKNEPDSDMFEKYEHEKPKQPIRLDIGNVAIPEPRNLSSDQRDSKNDVALLNKTHKSNKEINEYIQKVIQDAVPNEENKFHCPICDEMVSNRYSLGPHILRVHSKQKSKICPYCDRAFTCTGDLTRHIRIHTGDKPFKCTFPNCTYAFRASGDLHKHLRRHNTTDEAIRQHICDECDRGFERNYDLKRHKLTHKKNEEGVGYSCDYCPKRFVRRDQHRAHVYRHLGIKPYKCPDCDRSFGDFSNCSKHIKQCQAGEIYMDQRLARYMCDICQKRFKSKVGIQKHVVKCWKTTETHRNLQLAIATDDYI